MRTAIIIALLHLPIVAGFQSCTDFENNRQGYDDGVFVPYHAYRVQVRATWYYAVPNQTDSRWWEPKDNKVDIRRLNPRDTAYIAVTQDRWSLRKYKNCYIDGSVPCVIIDVLNRRYNGEDIIDILLPKGERLSKDSYELILF